MNKRESGIMIRRATIYDAWPIVLVLHVFFAEYQVSYTPEAFAATAPPAEQIHQRMNEGPIVGTVSAVVKNKAVSVRGLAILLAAQGQHLGRLLLEQVEAFASRQCAERLFLSTTPFLTHAISLYSTLVSDAVVKVLMSCLEPRFLRW